MSSVLDAYQYSEGYDPVLADPFPAAADGLKDYAPSVPDGLEQGTDDLAVYRAGDVVVLECEMIVPGVDLVQKERSDDSAGRDLGEKVQNVRIR